MNLILLILLSFMSYAGGEVSNTYPYTRMAKLYKKEQFLLEKSQERLRQRENQLSIVEERLGELSEVVSHRSHQQQHLTNPLHNLALVRRLTADWMVLANLAGDSSILPPTEKWPSAKDMEAMVRSVVRLQITYDLSTEDLARSYIQSTLAETNTTADDCIKLARHYYQHHKYTYAGQWLEQAIKKHVHKAPEATVLELVVLSKCFLGDSVGSLVALNSLVKNYPRHKPSQTLLPDWQLASTKNCHGAKIFMNKKRKRVELTTDESTRRHNWLCRESNKISSDLKCRYVHYNKTHLRLAPFRLEELQIDPPVIMFHNVISDSEIEEIKRVGLPELDISKVVSENGPIASIYRTSEVVWMDPRQSSVNVVLTRRMSDITNLDTTMAEYNQMSRYGVGGEYLLHLDALENNLLSGDRLATLMFYLSDVPRGGNTVFHTWQLSVKPEKGAAVFWFNLHPNGTVDDKSIHAGCSVLEGTKLVMNKWFHEFNNDPLGFCTPEPKPSYKYFYI